MHTVFITLPFEKGKREDILRDIATLTGAKYIDTQLGMSLKTVEIADLGRARNVRADKDKTEILYDLNEPTKDLIASLKKDHTEAEKGYYKDKIGDRLRSLENKSAVISTPLMDDFEYTELRLKLEDARKAMKSAAEDGVVAGGGIVFLNCKVGGTKGADLIQRVIQKPFEQMCKNSGIKRKPPRNYPIGLDFSDEKMKDLIEAGILDPTKVIKQEIMNSSTVASTLLTTEAIVIIKQ